MRPRGRHAASLLAALGVAASLAFASPAARADGDRARAQLLFDDAEKAAAQRRFDAALRDYRAAFDADPSAPFAPAARVRADDLAEHAEGGFEPLRRLEEVRRDPARTRDPVALEALERDAAAFPPGRVRSEARLVVADGYWHALGDARRGIPPLEAVLADPAADRLTRAVALSQLATIERSLGDLDAAVAAVDRHPELIPSLPVQLHRLVRRARLRRAAELLLAGLALVGSFSAARIARRRGARALPRVLVRPLAVAFALYVGAGGAVVARLHGRDDPRPFLVLGLGVLAVDLVARAWTAASREPDPPLRRAARALLCAAGVLAVGFLALERTQAGYLEGFGL